MASSKVEGGLASSREQRKNAGNKMSRLLADEMDDDEFYKTALGGFQEESGDDEYASEAEESDKVDSDFSFSETDEVIEQDEDTDGKRKRKKPLYKQQKRPKDTEEESSTKDREKSREFRPKLARTSSGSRKSTRALTVESSEMHRKRMERKPKAGKKKVRFLQIRRLSQKELLAEAKITEELNIQSLKAYQQMEESRKKSKNVKRVRTEAMIRFLSVSMPLIEGSEESENINVEDDGVETESGHHKEKSKVTEGSKCSRNFIIFTDPKTFPGQYFSNKKVLLPQKVYCPVTGLPAKYKDPLTGLPYATTQAFRYIREHYSKQNAEASEKHGEGKQRSSRRLSQQHTLI